MIFATHDLELTILMEGKLTNYHFQEDIKEKDIEFDYIYVRDLALLGMLLLYLGILIILQRFMKMLKKGY